MTSWRRSLRALSEHRPGSADTTAPSNAAGTSPCPAALAGFPLPICLPILPSPLHLYLRLHLSPRIILTSTLYVYVYFTACPPESAACHRVPGQICIQIRAA